MIKVWEKSKIDVYFEEEGQEQLVRQGFNNLVNDANEEQVGSFVETINSLHELPVAHAIVTDSHRYVL